MKQEAKIQQEIFIWFYQNYPNFIIHSVPNGISFELPPKEKSRVLSQMKNLGAVNGISDLIIHIDNGVCIMVEVKTEKGEQSDAQLKIEKKINTLNGNYILVRSLEDFQQQIKKYI